MIVGLQMIVGGVAKYMWSKMGMAVVADFLLQLLDHENDEARAALFCFCGDSPLDQWSDDMAKTLCPRIVDAATQSSAEQAHIIQTMRIM
ncbi:hypothetical protein KIPB_014993, partial [Kipferlia bialata]|eukprot:g14993.t1